MVDSRFCKLLKEGLKDEGKADRYYARLNLAFREMPGVNRTDLDILDDIRHGEQQHKVALTSLHNRHCR